MPFICERCGACCRLMGRTKFGKEFAFSDGVCKHLDRDSNLCKIYENRPIFCRVDEFYDLNLQGEISREAYYIQNKKACEELRKQCYGSTV